MSFARAGRAALRAGSRGRARKARPEHFGQLGFHVPVADVLVRDEEHDGPAIGILVAESRGRSMVEYALRGRNRPLAVSTCAGLPDKVREPLPAADDLARIADCVPNPSHPTG
ncbi:PDDEXK nuclease domain-containing protein [Streptomyces brevispora]|uniref:PDDEXK nuclease domain-containing protein n=1 Tax=Streptomyces brevispora TaxID=887462 RepID=UPI0038287943